MAGSRHLEMHGMTSSSNRGTVQWFLLDVKHCMQLAVHARRHCPAFVVAVLTCSQ